MRRVRPTPGTQLALFVEFTYHAFITDRPGATLALEADHRRHAEIENTIRDLKYGVGLNHLPSGRFGANAAWLTLNVIAHNLSRWVSRIGLGETLITHKTLRRRYLRVSGRAHSLRTTRNTASPRTMAMDRTVPHRAHQPARRRARHLTAAATRPPTNAPCHDAAEHAPSNRATPARIEPRPRPDDTPRYTDRYPRSQPPTTPKSAA